MAMRPPQEKQGTRDFFLANSDGTPRTLKIHNLALCRYIQVVVDTSSKAFHVDVELHIAAKLPQLVLVFEARQCGSEENQLS